MRICIRFLIVVGISLFLVLQVYGADEEYRFMHNDHDTLIIGEITERDSNTAKIKVTSYIVSSAYMEPRREQLRPEEVTVTGINEWSQADNLKVGDYILTDLNKSKKDGTFKVAWKIFQVTSLDYRTLKVETEDPFDSARYTDFVNSGGKHSKHYQNGNKVISSYDGKETVIYEGDKVEKETQDEKATHNSVSTYQYLLGGLGIGIIAIGSIWIYKRRNRK